MLLCSFTNRRMMIKRREEETMMAATAPVGADEGERMESRAWGVWGAG